MNNHWHTNYRAYQEGPVEFRFVVRPHGVAGAAEAARFAADCCQPLVALPGRGAAPDARPLVSVAPANVLATALKPSDDGQALILRLFNAGDAAAEAKLAWGRQAPRHLWITDTSERPLRKWSADQALPIPASGIVALRVELAD